eukprot:g11923.t1 g11923   contig6:870031-870459(+)
MVLGRAGMKLEAQKFALYLLIPITASIVYNEPSVQQWSADYFQFMKYPSNPKTNLKQEFEELRKQREEDAKEEERRKKGREEYLMQLKKLNVARGGGGGSENGTVDDATTTQRRGWFGWPDRWRRGKDSSSSSAGGDGENLP